MAVSKRISYPEKTETKVIKFPHIKVVEKKTTTPINPEEDWKSGANWWDLEDEDPYYNWEPKPGQLDKSRLEGIISQVPKRFAALSEKETREYLGGFLVPKGYREEDIMKMPMKDLLYIFDQVMSL